MARPAKPEPVWTDLTYDRWASRGDNLQAARDLRLQPATRALLTVLVNERPSAKGATDASFCLGYESAVALVKQFLDGVPATAPATVPRVTYASPEAAAEMSWSPKSE